VIVVTQVIISAGDSSSNKKATRAQGSMEYGQFLAGVRGRFVDILMPGIGVSKSNAAHSDQVRLFPM
jgi:hypothetical protein